MPSHGKRDEWAVVAITISFIGLGSYQKKKRRHESKINIHNNTEILAHIEWMIEILIDSLVDP